MSDLTINAYNTTLNSVQLATFVGGIVPPIFAAAFIPLVWNIEPFPKVDPTGEPGESTVVWPQTYGLSVLSTINGSVWKTLISIDNLPLGTVVTLSYDNKLGTYIFGNPTPGGPDGTLTVNLDNSISVNPIIAVGLGVNINGIPTGLLPSFYFSPKFPLVFTVTPTYSIAAVENLVLSQVVDHSVIASSLLLQFTGSVTLQEATWLPNRSWLRGPPPPPTQVARPAVSLSISPFGHLTLDIFRPAAKEEGKVGEHLSLPGPSHLRGFRA